jgi:predicted phosphodiesterase
MSKAWAEAEIEAAAEIDKAKQHSKFVAELPAGRVAAITFVSDQHIAPGSPCDFKRMREDAELIAKTRDLYAILGGDGCDNHVKHLGAIIAARSRPSDQFLLYEHYLKTLKDRILCVTSGNHDLWTLQIAGQDMVSWLCKANKIAYAPNEARIVARIGKQEYKIAVRHQFRMNSSFNQSHSVKQWLRLGDEDFDVGCVGHHHEACVEQTIYRGKVVWVCRPGAYQVTSSFSQTYGWNMSIPTCPTFLLFPDRRHIIGLHDIRDAPKILKAFNG